MRCALAILAVICLAACGPRVPRDDERCELGNDVVGGIAEPEAQVRVPLPRKRAWEAGFGGEVAARPHVAARMAGWPRTRLATGSADGAVRTWIVPSGERRDLWIAHANHVLDVSYSRDGSYLVTAGRDRVDPEARRALPGRSLRAGPAG